MTQTDTDARQVDVAIIGAGTAGMAAYRKVAKQTDSVLLIEGDAYGTTCARVGCMPSKLLVAAAEAAQAGRHAEEFGVGFGPARIDGAAVMRRVKQMRDGFVQSVRDSVAVWPAEHRILARARFTGADSLALTPLDGAPGLIVRAGATIIATGASPVLPEPFAAAGPDIITSDDVFGWDELPGSVAVFGAGVVGLELGQALHRLGVRVVLLGKERSLAQISDPAVRDCALDLFRGELDFHPDHDLKTCEAAPGGGVRVAWTAGTGDGDAVFDKALVAVGRAPNVSDLGLETTGLDLDDTGVPRFDPRTGRCGESSIYIAGDASDLVPLLHIAAHQGKTAGPNAAAHPDVTPSDLPAGLSVTFCDPQIATAGRGCKALTDDGVDFDAGEIDWSEQGRARVMGVDRGLTRLYGDRATGRLVGAEMVGPSAEHLAHLLAWSIDAGETVADLLERPFYHPCLEEGLRTALRDLAYKLGARREEPVPKSLDCGPGG